MIGLFESTLLVLHKKSYLMFVFSEEMFKTMTLQPAPIVVIIVFTNNLILDR